MPRGQQGEEGLGSQSDEERVGGCGVLSLVTELICLQIFEGSSVEDKIDSVQMLQEIQFSSI